MSETYGVHQNVRHLMWLQHQGATINELTKDISQS